MYYTVHVFEFLCLCLPASFSSLVFEPRILFVCIHIHECIQLISKSESRLRAHFVSYPTLRVLAHACVTYTPYPHTHLNVRLYELSSTIFVFLFASKHNFSTFFSVLFLKGYSFTFHLKSLNQFIFWFFIFYVLVFFFVSLVRFPKPKTDRKSVV